MHEIKIPISWKTIKEIHKAIIAAAPNPPRPGFREAYSKKTANRFRAAVEQACALLEQLGKELHLTPASREIITSLRAALDED